MPPVIVQRSILVGAALGLYFGWFFRPAREPSLFTPIILGLFITVVMAVWRFVRKERENFARRLLVTFASTALFLYILEARHIALDIGGRPLVLAMMAVCGAISGYVYATRMQL